MLAETLRVAHWPLHALNPPEIVLRCNSPLGRMGTLRLGDLKTTDKSHVLLQEESLGPAPLTHSLQDRGCRKPKALKSQAGWRRHPQWNFKPPRAPGAASGVRKALEGWREQQCGRAGWDRSSICVPARGRTSWSSRGGDACLPGELGAGLANGLNLEGHLDAPSLAFDSSPKSERVGVFLPLGLPAGQESCCPLRFLRARAPAPGL